MNEQEYIEQRLDDQLAWYDGKSAWNQKCYKGLRMVEVVLAAGIPFVSSLIGRFPDSPNAFPIIVSVIAFLIAAISALLALYRFQDNWMQYRNVAEQLKREKLLFLTKSQPYAGEDPFHVLVENIEKILGEENNTWREQVKSANTANLSQQVREQVKAIVAEETQKVSST